MKAKNPPQDMEEMVTSEAQRMGNKLFDHMQMAEFNSEQISDMVNRVGGELRAASKKPHSVSLSDIPSVKQITLDYFKACEKAGTVPSMSGLSRALGHSRQSLYNCINRQSPAEAAKWFELCKDAISEVLEMCALGNNVNSITAIFLLKAQFGYKEGVEIFTNKQDDYGPLGPPPTVEEIKARLGIYDDEEIAADDDQQEEEQNKSFLERFDDLPDD